MRIIHRFVTSYCPWTSGTMKRLCKEVLRVARDLLSEWKMSEMQWSTLVQAVQKVISHSPLKTLGNFRAGTVRCPMEVFTGLTPSPLLVRPVLLETYRGMRVLDEELARRIIDAEAFHDASERGIKTLQKVINASARTQQLHNGQTKVLPLNICGGEYVMACVHVKRGSRLQAKWRGPIQVIEKKSNLFLLWRI